MECKSQRKLRCGLAECVHTAMVEGERDVVGCDGTGRGGEGGASGEGVGGDGGGGEGGTSRGKGGSAAARVVPKVVGRGCWLVVARVVAANVAVAMVGVERVGVVVMAAVSS